MSRRRTSNARPNTSSGMRGSSGGPARWFGTVSSPKKNTLIAVRMRPLSGIGVSRTKSNAEIRSVATNSRCSSSTRYSSRTLPLATCW
ncbi:Uncharacterised protein [Mycobacteroides abscessus subsp. abscessus]|nr:Uncharacterised protein [Mycobacteroides abscessus subsp. abscessus]